MAVTPVKRHCKRKTRSSTGRSERHQPFSVCFPAPPLNKVAGFFFSPLQQGFTFLLMCFLRCCFSPAFSAPPFVASLLPLFTCCKEPLYRQRRRIKIMRVNHNSFF
ncbi:hypothetical protein RchiOBHm_Chr6g0267641 [Rosa chinensis]|nr:hypothetical protein RchiOBHm_Chr6g0267641 [Rosa chinensis]